MHITWIVSGPVEKRGDGRTFSRMASVRYRVLYVAEHLAACGHRVDIIQSDVPTDSAMLSSPLEADVVIVSKGLFEGSVAITERAKRCGTKVLLDLCDDHFESSFRETYLALCDLADGLTASTPTMAHVITKHTGRDATVIEDPFEAPHMEPRFRPSERLRLLWFGHPTNFDTLSDMLASLVDFARERPVDLHVVSEAAASIVSALESLGREHAPRLTTRFTPWSQEATWQAIKDCDVVVIPSLPIDAKLVKSPNRIVESIRCGRFVSAYPLPSYQPFHEFAWLGENVIDGLRWAEANPHKAESRIRSGQLFVEREFSPTRLAVRWETTIAGYAASRAAKFAKPA